MKKSAGVNKKYKDGMFRTLFKDPEKSRELINAAKGTNYGPDAVIKEVTLSGAMYLKHKNDLAFLVNDEIVFFIEHQSTINRNIALRMLWYAARTYEAIIGSKNIYGPKEVKIPKAAFYVFYNGDKKFPKRQKMRLSDLYKEKNGKRTFALDLTVEIYNINIGNNPGLLKRSQTLYEYELFIEAVRKYRNECKLLRKAIKLAADECINKGILADFLKTHASEVVNMLFTEYDAVQDRKDWIEFGKEEGMAKVFALLENGMSLEEAKKTLYKKSTPRR